MDEYKDYKIKLWCFDTQVYNEEDFSADGGKDLLDYEILGGGGTDFEAQLEYMKFNDIPTKKFIMFTDGYPYLVVGATKIIVIQFLLFTVTEIKHYKHHLE